VKPRYLTVLGGLLVAGITVAILLASRGTHKPPTHRPRRPVPATQFGANVGRLFNDQDYRAGAIAAQLSALRRTGATIARSDALWEATEPAPPRGGDHRYEWGFDDSIAAALATADLRWLPIIDYSAPWAQSVRGREHSPPSSPADYAAYAAAVARRYGPGGTFWSAHPALRAEPVQAYEIWNEPDNDTFWYPAPDPAAYADLYLRARAAVHAVQPAARVLVGGLTHPTSFLPALLAASPALRGQLDAVAIHPYDASPDAVLRSVADVRQTLARLGMGSVPLYVTEFGWTTSPPGALDYQPARLRPSYIERTLSGLGQAGCGIAGVFIYAWLTPERNPRDPQDWFGIHPPSGAPSPDSQAFAQGLAAATGSAPEREACPQP
jgi:hypothetical protein